MGAVSGAIDILEIFRTFSLSTNIDYLLWRLLKEAQIANFSWMNWYIWKIRNDIIFKILESDPREVLQWAENKTRALASAQEEVNSANESIWVSNSLDPPHVEAGGFMGYWCFIDAFRKEDDIFSRRYCFKSNSAWEHVIFERIFHHCTYKQKQYLLWAMRCLKRWSEEGEYSHRKLFRIGEDGIYSRCFQLI